MAIWLYAVSWLLTFCRRYPFAEQLTDGSTALLELAKKVNATSPVESQPQQPQKSVYLGEEYVNNKTLADVVFQVDGRPFYAHRIALLASSDHFKAMFNQVWHTSTLWFKAIYSCGFISFLRSKAVCLNCFTACRPCIQRILVPADWFVSVLQGFKESVASSIEIPNIDYSTFTTMMRYIYVGTVEVEPEQAMPLLQASDQYLLEGLKRLCEATLAQVRFRPIPLVL